MQLFPPRKYYGSPELAPLVLLMGRLRLGRMFQSFDVLTNRPTADTVVITVMLDTVPPVGPIPVRRTGEH